MDKLTAIVLLLRAVRVPGTKLALAKYAELMEPVSFLAALCKIKADAICRLFKDFSSLDHFDLVQYEAGDDDDIVSYLTQMRLDKNYVIAYNNGFISEDDHVDAIPPEVQAALPWPVTRQWLGHDNWYLGSDEPSNKALVRLLRACLRIEPALRSWFWDMVLEEVLARDSERQKALLRLARRQALSDRVIARELPLEQVIDLVPREKLWTFVNRIFDIIEAEELSADVVVVEEDLDRDVEEESGPHAAHAARERRETRRGLPDAKETLRGLPPPPVVGSDTPPPQRPGTAQYPPQRPSPEKPPPPPPPRSAKTRRF